MILSKKSGGGFEPHPETDGFVKGVIVDITPLKESVGQFGAKQTFRLVFESELKKDNGEPYCVWSRPYTPSLHEKAHLRKDLEKMLGRKLTAEEEEAFDVEAKLLGLPVLMIITHREWEGKSYAEISMIKPDKTDNSLKPSGKFVREKDREKKDGSGGNGGSYRKAPEADGGRMDWQKVKIHGGPKQGLELGDLDEADVRLYIDNWLPKAKAKEKPTADDKRLIAALEEVQRLLEGASQEGEGFDF